MRVAGQPSSSHAAAGRWLDELQRSWVDAARDRLARQRSVARVTVVAVRGSAPREAGTTMLIDALGTVGTIGGGRLEWQATAAARQVLDGAAGVRIEDFVLGPQLGQCCGGRVELWIERLTRADLRWLDLASSLIQADRHSPAGSIALETTLDGRCVSHRVLPQSAAALALRRTGSERASLVEPLSRRRPALWVCGAGHVGQALIRLLSPLAACEITWIDSRAQLLPPDLVEGVTTCAVDPRERIALAPAHSRHVILTHDHALDYELCLRILARNEFSWLGLIGSASKAARFRARLARDGIAEPVVARLTCPIGSPGIRSKHPGAIAIAIAAELLALPESGAGDAVNVPGAAATGSPCAAADCAACARAPEPPA